MNTLKDTEALPPTTGYPLLDSPRITVEVASKPKWMIRAERNAKRRAKRQGITVDELRENESHAFEESEEPEEDSLG